MAEFTAYYMKGTRFTDVELMTKLVPLTVTLEVLLQSPFNPIMTGGGTMCPLNFRDYFSPRFC